MVRGKQRCAPRESRGGIELVSNRTDFRSLIDVPPWDWPRDAGKRFLEVLNDRQASEEDRLIVAGLAGSLTVINDALADALMGIVCSADQPEELRAAAAISLGPVLEQADTSGFEDDPEDIRITAQTFHRIQLTLHTVYADDSVPRLVRRRILEASVRSPQDWHRDAISQAYLSGDRDWMLTALFAMERVRGFDVQILEALKSGDPEIQYEAVSAAGNWELDAAWDHVAALAEDSAAPKALRIAAIGAVGGIRPLEATGILSKLTESDDEDIAETAEEALMMAEARSGDGFDEDDEDEDEDAWLN
jgi:hypothetical protein